MKRIKKVMVSGLTLDERRFARDCAALRRRDFVECSKIVCFAAAVALPCAAFVVGRNIADMVGCGDPALMKAASRATWFFVTANAPLSAWSLWGAPKVLFSKRPVFTSDAARALYFAASVAVPLSLSALAQAPKAAAPAASGTEKIETMTYADQMRRQLDDMCKARHGRVIARRPVEPGRMEIVCRDKNGQKTIRGFFDQNGFGVLGAGAQPAP